MRERLIELLKSTAHLDVLYDTDEEWKDVADYLLKNGVIVPPDIKTIKWTAEEMLEQWNEITGAIPKGTGWYFEIESIIDDVVCLAFGAGMLYREEAEQALKERERDTE